MRQLNPESTLDYRKQEFLKLKDAVSDFFEVERTKSRPFKKLEKFYGFNNAYSLDFDGDKRQFQLGFSSRPYEIRKSIDGKMKALMEESALLVFSQDARGRVYVMLYPSRTQESSLRQSLFMPIRRASTRLVGRRFVLTWISRLLVLSMANTSLNFRPNWHERLRFWLCRQVFPYNLENEYHNSKLREFCADLGNWTIRIGIGGTVALILNQWIVKEFFSWMNL